MDKTDDVGTTIYRRRYKVLNLHGAPEVFALISGEPGDQWVSLCNEAGEPIWGISVRCATDGQAIAEAVRALKLPHRGPVGAEFIGEVGVRVEIKFGRDGVPYGI